MDSSSLPDASPPKAEKGADIDWAAVREAYELSDETVPAIRDRFGLSRYELEKRRTAEGWTTRPQIARPGVRRSGGNSIGDRAIEYRLNRLVTTGLAMLEKRIVEEGMSETNARTLTELIRAQEIRMRSRRNEKAAKAREKKNSDAGTDYRDDPAWLDAELARRLDRLSEESGAAGASQGSDAGREARGPRSVGKVGPT